MIFGLATLALGIILSRRVCALPSPEKSQAQLVPGAPSDLSPSSPITRVLKGVNFPDPVLYHFKGKWYALGTNNAAWILSQSKTKFAPDYGKANIQIASSDDLEKWNLDQNFDVLSKAGDWAPSGTSTTDEAPPAPKASVWAPDLYQQTSGAKDFLLYYAAASSSSNKEHCIGVAKGSSENGPSGPFTPTSSKPLVCHSSEGGAIDASIIAPTSSSGSTHGNLYMVYKIDGNSKGHGGECGNTKAPQHSTPIMLQQLSNDGLQLLGNNATQILDRTEEDGPLVEAPVLVQSDEGVFFLFFSSGCTRDNDYTVKYATSSRIDGGYQRASEPLLKTGTAGGLVAPGSVSVRKVEGQDGLYVMAFAARVQSEYGGVRELFLSGLKLKGRTATLEKIPTSGS
jgi:beta-xylosidase